MLERVDANVGRVLDELDRLGLAGRTVVFFASDNGPHSEGGHDPHFFRSSGGLRGGKRDLTEGGVRVPLLVRWPGVIRAGSETGHVSAFWDLLPTFAELGGAKVSSVTEGISFVPTLRGTKQPQHEFLYWENQEGTGRQAVRWGKWKAVREGVMLDAAVPYSLYDLEADPAETTDVAAQHPAVTKRLARFAAESHEPSPRAPLFPSERQAAAAPGR